MKPTTFTPALAGPTCRKVKDLLVGMPCTDADVNTVETMGPAGLQQLIITWMTDSTFQPQFQGKMVPFFRNLFQQIGFTPTDDFKPQLLENGGFDFGPLGTGAVGDDDTQIEMPDDEPYNFSGGRTPRPSSSGSWTT